MCINDCIINKAEINESMVGVFHTAAGGTVTFISLIVCYFSVKTKNNNLHIQETESLLIKQPKSNNDCFNLSSLCSILGLCLTAYGLYDIYNANPSI